MTRILRFLGNCPHCKRAWTELVVCVCGHKAVNHRLDLKRLACEIEGCPCTDYTEREGQEDRDPRGNAA